MTEVLAAAKHLEEKGISTEVVSMHSIKPLDIEYLFSAVGKFKMIATVEEHGTIGGLGGGVAEWRSAANAQIPHVSFGTPDEFMHEVGSQEYAREKYGLTAANIASRIEEKYCKL